MSGFKHRHGERTASQLMLSITGPSGGGKTLSALRLAQGMLAVIGGKIFIIDSDGGKCNEYAPPTGEKADPAKFTFDFESVELGPPYSSLRYREAIMYCSRQGAGIVVVDQMSYEHDGEGGYLEFGDEEAKRVGKSYGANWRAPKQDRRKLMQSFAQSRANLILLFRAEEKLDWKEKTRNEDKSGKKSEPRPLGWMPVGGNAFCYEMNAGLVLEPASDGVFVADPKSLTNEQKMVFKVRSYFKPLLAKAGQIDEELGRKMALWSTGGKVLTAAERQQREELTVASAASPLTAPSRPTIQTGPDRSEPCRLCAANPPKCSCNACEKHKGKCGIKMLWRGSEMHPKFGLRPGRWYCPNKCTPTKTTVNGTDWHAVLVHRMEGGTKYDLVQEEPGASG